MFNTKGLNCSMDMKSRIPSYGKSKCILTNQSKVPNNSNDNTSHTCASHSESSLKTCDKCIPVEFTVTKPLLTINKGAGLVDIAMNGNTKLPNETLKLSSFLKVLAVLLLVCDVLYLNINLQNIKDSLKSSSQSVENLESQLKFAKLSYETFKADVNYLMYLNRMFTKDINSKIELLIILNRLFVDRADTSLNAIVNILRNQKHNDNEITRVVNRRKMYNAAKKVDMNATFLFDKKFATDRFQLKSIRDKGHDAFNIVLGGNNVSSFDSFDLEKKEINKKIMFGNATSRDFMHSDVHRTKRQTADSSQTNRGPLLTHFRGAQPEALIQDGGSVIAPWFGDLTASGDYINRNIFLREGKTKLEVTEKGLYLIYAQVYYLTSNQLNSFSINIQNEKASERVIAMCSTEAAIQGMSEVSCYTSVVHQLDPGDKIFLIQRERYRRVIFREGHTFLGVVVLNNPPKC